MVAVALGAFFYVVTHWIDLQSTCRWPPRVLVVFALIALTFDLLVYRPLNGLIRRARKRLGGNYERNDPYYRDEARELGHLVGTLIAVFTAADDKEWVSQSIKADLERVQALNRQLMDVGELGKEMNAALPYPRRWSACCRGARPSYTPTSRPCCCSTPTRAPSRSKGAQGVLSPTLSAECCAFTPDCPVRQAIAGGRLVRTADHTCTLFPHTMKDQVVIPVHVENVGDMAVLATSTTGDYVALLSDDILIALQNHVQSALTNAHKYDAIRRPKSSPTTSRAYTTAGTS